MFGVPADRAVSLAGDIDDVMAQSILALYRSAIDVGREWGPDFKDIPKPGLVLIPSEDPFLSTGGDRTAAGRAGASMRRSSKGSATGGCSRTLPKGPRFSSRSGRRSTSHRQAPMRRGK